MNGEFIDFLAETANEIDEALINNPQLKSSIIKHAEKLMTEAEKYLEYINGEYQKAAKKGYTKHDEQPKGKGWFWYSSYSKNTTYYFPQNGPGGMVTFWMKGEPKPDPLNYLFSMVLDCAGELYKGLEINDYRCLLLACIHDAQRIAAGQERIHFQPQDTRELKNRVCINVWQKLSESKYHTAKNLQQTIKTAFHAIKANLEHETKTSRDNSTTIPQPNKEKAKKLYEIVDVLKEFKEYTKGRTDQATRNTPKARQLVRKAMTLLADNLKLLKECKNKYGCHSPLQECFECIEQAASFLRTKDLGDYSYWVCNFCKPRLWDGVKRSFADECMRYANEVDREINEQKVIISLGEYENEHGNKIGISPADLEREVEMTWPQLRPVLDRLGRKGLIEGHKGDGYTSYWLSVEFDENDPYKHQCSVKEFRLTQQGQKLYGKIAEKPAKTAQENKDTKSEQKGMIEVHKPFYKKRWAKIIGVLSGLLLITTLLINLKTIKEWFYPPKIQPSTSKVRQLPLTNENKLSVSLKEICKDIDSRPLLQQEETAKRYIGINIQEEHLKLFDIHEYPEDGTFGLTMILPHESDESYLTGRKIFCTVERDKHPQLNAAKRGIEFYVSGQIKDAGSTYIELSDVSLKFD